MGRPTLNNWLRCRSTTLSSVHRIYHASLTDPSISSAATSWSEKTKNRIVPVDFAETCDIRDKFLNFNK